MNTINIVNVNNPIKLGTIILLKKQNNENNPYHDVLFGNGMKHHFKKKLNCKNNKYNKNRQDNDNKK